jgi:hypothetical protein
VDGGGGGGGGSWARVGRGGVAEQYRRQGCLRRMGRGVRAEQLDERAEAALD